ncbi:hypothetical protein BCY88_01540 [Paraburkholderia fungorum]|uniref:Uncharacterized protein n=1 Tax=Paraburkholderia fungorum TaxID=134537 RepID=A0A3R7EWD9_9BURK|nr:hypothetical protein BCY88_01540 [Paraburkholderia fungorum]
MFIKPASRIAYSADFIRLVLAEQYTYYLDGVSFDKDVIDESEFNRLQFRLRRRASRSKPFYFAIDGLHQITKEDFRAIDAIFKEILPIGWEHFKFLVVGKQVDFEPFIHKIQARYYQQLKFSLGETKDFLGDINLSEDELGALYKLCDGIPARLASVKRLVNTGVSVEEIFQSEPSKYLEFIRLEYAPIDQLTHDSRRLLAILAFSNRQLPIIELLEVARLEKAALDKLIETFSFISINNSTHEVEFASEAHRRFASNILSSMKSEALTSQIEYLVANPQSHVALRFLPTYYQQVGQTRELVRLLSSEHFSHLLDSTSSIASLRTRAELGVKSAVLLKEATDVFGFSIKRSLFASLAGAEGAKAEIRALVALGRPAAALGLAQDSVVREERFAFLCTYARQLVESGEPCDVEVLRLIKESASLIDFADLGDRAIDIASELVAVDAGLALSIVVGATEHAGNTMDKQFAVARLAIAATKGQGEKNIASLNEASKQISDEKMQGFISELISLVSSMSSAQVISSAQMLDAVRRLPFLCFWASSHRQDVDAIEVVEYALNYMIDDSAYSPKMSDLRNLSLPLAYAPKSPRVETLIRRVDSQRGLIKDSSLSIDSVSLQVTLAHAEMAFGDEKKAIERVVDTYLELTGVDNAEVKLECFAILLEGLRLMDPDARIEAEQGFRALITLDLQSLLTQVLENSADHFLIVKGALRAFANTDLPGAWSICARLNLMGRRDLAYGEVAEALYEDGVMGDTVSNVLDTLARVHTRATRDTALGRFVRVISKRKYVLEEHSITLLAVAIAECPNPDFRVGITPRLIEIWANSSCPGPMPSLDLFDSDLALASASWLRVNPAFAMASSLAKVAPVLADAYYGRGSQFRNNSEYCTYDFFVILMACLGLAVRALHGALNAKCVIDDPLDRFLRLADLVPSIPARIDLIGDLASKAWTADRADIALKLLKSKSLPAIEDARRSSEYLHRYLIKLSFPSLYCTQQQLALTYAKELSLADAEAASLETVDLILRRETKSDPSLDEAVNKFRITYGDALSTCTLIETLKTDNSIYWCINELCSTITSKVNKTSFTRNQREDLATRLSTFFRENLPDVENIKHDGYLILCEACILTLREDTKITEWQALATRGRAIPNAADAGFVLYELAELVPTKFDSLPSLLRTEVNELFKTLPSPIDQINRLIQVSKNARGAGVNLAKEQLRSAMLMTLKAHDEDIAKQSRRRIVDIAEKISPEFANELLELIDQDPARATARLEVRQRLRTLKVKKKLANAKSPDDIAKSEVKHLPEAAWMNVAGLMTGRLETKAPELMIGYLHRSSSLPLSDAYPVLAWHIENLARKFSKSEQGSQQMDSLVEQVLLTCELAENITSRITARKTKKITSSSEIEPVQIGVNNREAALDFIGEWLSLCDSDVWLCDPYFGPDEIDIFKLVLSNCPGSSLTIITAKRFLAEKSALTAEAFWERWNLMMDQDLPTTKIIGVSYADGAKAPIHDRWLVAGGRGLRLGTSIGSIGTGKLSEISTLFGDELTRVRANLEPFVREDRTVGGARIHYHSLTL